MLSPHTVYSLPRQISADPARAAQARAIVESAIAAAFAVPIHELRAASRGAAPIAFARQSAMYLAHVVLGLSYSDVGRTFGRDRTTAAHACRLVEERREDPLVDATLGALEQALRPNLMVERAVLQP